MMLPLFWLYIWRKAARVVRKAPSRWMESNLFHLSNSNSTSGATIWTPALLTDVEAPEGFDRPRHSALDLLLVASIHANSERTFAHRIDLGRRFLGRVLIKIRDDHLCPLADEG